MSPKLSPSYSSWGCLSYHLFFLSEVTHCLKKWSLHRNRSLKAQRQYWLAWGQRASRWQSRNLSSSLDSLIKPLSTTLCLKPGGFKGEEVWWLLESSGCGIKLHHLLVTGQRAPGQRFSFLQSELGIISPNVQGHEHERREYVKVPINTKLLNKCKYPPHPSSKMPCGGQPSPPLCVVETLQRQMGS